VPAQIDETYEAPLPPQRPHCQHAVRLWRVARQYQEELPVQRPLVRLFHVAIGECAPCHARVQGRHPLQTSDALGAAAVQLGPEAVALAVILNKQLGLSYGKITQLLRDRSAPATSQAQCRRRASPSRAATTSNAWVVCSSAPRADTCRWRGFKRI
jgi:hypothetical protein